MTTFYPYKEKGNKANRHHRINIKPHDFFIQKEI